MAMALTSRLKGTALTIGINNYMASSLSRMSDGQAGLLALALNNAGFSNGQVNPKLMSDELRKILIHSEFTRSERTIDATLDEHYTAGAIPQRTSYKQLLKNMSMDMRLALACTMGDPLVVDYACASYAESKSWSKWLAQEGFDRKGLRVIIENELTKRGMSGGSVVMPTAKTDAFVDLDMDTETEKEMGDDELLTALKAPVAQAVANTVNPALKPIIDGVLTQAGLAMSIDQLLAFVSENAVLNASVTRLNDELSDALRKATTVQAIVPVAASGTLPGGTYKMQQAATVFKQMADFGFDVPVWTWDHVHPDVPVIDPDYVFRKDLLLSVLLAISTGDMAWLVGHTGAGKTTLVEQVCAHLGYPVARIAFDSSVDRNELVGRMDLRGDGKGGTDSQWKAGVLEYAIPNGYVLICDEVDAARPDALYVMQPLLERKGLRLLEDGGRMVDFHPVTRIFATGNTAGSGDPSGLYPACRILSAATLDRFSNFIEVPYLSNAEEKKLIKSKVPGLNASLLTNVTRFAGEMREAFVKGEIPISYSPRRSIAFARKVDLLMSMTKNNAKPLSETDAVGMALRTKLFNAAPNEFRQRITEIARNVFGNVDPTKSI